MTGLAVVMVMVSMDQVSILEFREDCSPSAVVEGVGPVVDGDTVEAARGAKLSHGWLPNNGQCWMGGAVGGKDVRERSHRVVGEEKCTITLSPYHVMG
jgi:hypothetical protein